MLTFILPHDSLSYTVQVGILKRVLEEVEKVMHEFKGMLYKSMEDPQTDLTEVSADVYILLTFIFRKVVSSPVRPFVSFCL